MSYPGYPSYYPSAYTNYQQMPQYQPQVPQYQPQAAPQQEQAIQNWVQGEAGMKAFVVKPNGSALIFDTERDYFYIKSADASGMPSQRTFEYREITNQPQVQAQNTGDFVPRAEFEALKAKIDELLAQKGTEE